MNQFKASKAAAHAINSHDKLVEQVKLLREALEGIIKIAEFPPVDKLILDEARKALEATK